MLLTILECFVTYAMVSGAEWCNIVFTVCTSDNVKNVWWTDTEEKQNSLLVQQWLICHQLQSISGMCAITNEIVRFGLQYQYVQHLLINMVHNALIAFYLWLIMEFFLPKIMTA